MRVTINNKYYGICGDANFNKDEGIIIYRALTLSSEGKKYFSNANTIELYDLEYNIANSKLTLIQYIAEIEI